MFVDDLFDVMLDALGSHLVKMSLHTSVPDSTGSNEVTGGDYARQGATWAPASGGRIDLDSPVQFSVPEGTDISHVGFWTDDGGDVWRGYLSLPAPEKFGVSGTVTVASCELTLNNTDA